MDKLKVEKEKDAKVKADLAALAIKVPLLKKKFELDLVLYNACANSASTKMKLFLDDKRKGVVDETFPADKIYNEVKEKFQTATSSYRDLEEAMVR